MNMPQLQCPNPDCGHSTIRVTTVTCATYHGQGCTWPLLSFGSTWEAILIWSCVWWLLVGLAWMIWGISLFWAIAVIPALLLDGFLFFLYLKDYVSAHKIRIQACYCPRCRYIWTRLASPAALAAEWNKGELARYRKLGNKQYIAVALSSASEMALHQKDYQGAEALAEEGLALAREQKLDREASGALCGLGLAALYQGHYERAISYLEESLTLYRKTKQWQGVSYALNDLGLAVLYQGDDTRATSLFVESLAFKLKMVDKHGLAWAFEGLAGVAQVRQQPERAARLYGAGRAMRDAVEFSFPLDDCPGFSQSLNVTRAQLGEAAYAAAWEEGYAMPMDAAIMYALDVDNRSEPSVS